MNTVRTVTAHAVKGDKGDMGLKVQALGEYSEGGAQSRYMVLGPDQERLLTLLFQDGNPTEGVNGVSLEAVLACCLDRLDCFQAGPFANPYNAEARYHIEQAIEALKDRTRERDRKEGAAQ